MHIFEAQAGVFYGVGVGPGDALLITLKAHYLIQSADVICYLASAKGVPNSATSKAIGGTSQARNIAHTSILGRADLPKEIAIPMPMSTDRTAANAAYDLGASTLLNN